MAPIAARSESATASALRPTWRSENGGARKWTPSISASTLVTAAPSRRGDRGVVAAAEDQRRRALRATGRSDPVADRRDQLELTAHADIEPRRRRGGVALVRIDGAGAAGVRGRGRPLARPGCVQIRVVAVRVAGPGPRVVRGRGGRRRRRRVVGVGRVGRRIVIAARVRARVRREVRRVLRLREVVAWLRRRNGPCSRARSAPRGRRRSRASAGGSPGCRPRPRSRRAGV